MPKVRLAGAPFCFPKGMSLIDRDIVQKIIDIRDCEKNLLEVKKNLLEVNQEILNARTALLNLQARQENLEGTIRKEQNELFKLYDDKIFRDTVAFNR